MNLNFYKPVIAHGLSKFQFWYVLNNLYESIVYLLLLFHQSKTPFVLIGKIIRKKSELGIGNSWTQVLYMSSSFWLLVVESRDFSQAEKENTASKAEQIHKMATIVTPNDNLGPFWVKMVVILWIGTPLEAVLSF